MDNAAMTQLIGISFTSVWWPFGVLVALCLIGTPVDRLAKKLCGSMKLLRFVLDGAVNCAVLFLLDRLIDGISMNWWAVLVLAVLAAAMMVFSGSDE